MMLFFVSLLALSQVSLAFNTFDCGYTKFCISVANTGDPQKPKTDCNVDITNQDDPNFCHFAMSYKQTDNPNYVQIQLRRPRNSTSDINYVALGLSHDNQMGDDSVMQCVFNSSSSTAEVALSWNNDTVRGNENIPADMDTDNGTYNIRLVDSYQNDDVLSCTFNRRIEPKIGHYGSQWGHDMWNLTGHYFLLMSFGEARSTGALMYHGNNKVVLSKNTDDLATRFNDTTSVDDKDCGNGVDCYFLPQDCQRNETNQMGAKYCKALLFVTQNTKDDDYYTMEMFATRNNTEFRMGRTYIATGFSQTDGMGNASVVHCIFEKNLESANAFQSYNLVMNDKDRKNIVLPEEVSDKPNVQFLSAKEDGNYLSCKVKRKVAPAAELNPKTEVFQLTQEYSYIMAWGSAADGQTAQLQYHGPNNRGYVGKSKVAKNFNGGGGGAASTHFLSVFTSLFAIAIYALLKL